MNGSKKNLDSDWIVGATTGVLMHINKWGTKHDE